MTSFHKIHNYLIGETIGKGRFASVRVCYSNNSKRALCAKLINKLSLNKSNETTSIVFNEKYLAPLLVHPNILEVIEVFDTQRTTFQISKLYENGSLLNLMRKQCLTYDQKVQIAADIINAINYLHENFIVHRDIKLENVLITAKNTQKKPEDIVFRAKICDFGLSSIVFNKDGKIFDRCGSFHYVSPECVNFGKNGYDGFKSDIWSLGVLMFALFTNRLPYPDLENDLVNGFDKEPDFSLIENEEMKKLIMSLLEKLPKNRPTISKIAENEIFKLKCDVKSSNIFDFESLFSSEDGETPDYFDSFAVSRVSQMLQISYSDCEKDLRDSENMNIPKLFYKLFLERIEKTSSSSSTNLNHNIGGGNGALDMRCSIQISGSCPTSLSHNLLMKTFQAPSKSVLKVIHEFVTARNGCISEPTCSNDRTIVINRAERDLVLSFDCFDVEDTEDDECDVMITDDALSGEIVRKLSEVFHEIE